MRRLGEGAARVVVLAFCWVTALYAFTASSAFAYLQLIKPRVFWWLAIFSDTHAVMSWAWLAALLSTLLPHVRAGARAVIPARLLVGGAVAAVVWNTAKPAVPALHDGPWSVVVGVVALLPVLLLALVDHVNAWPNLQARVVVRSLAAVDGRLFTASMAAAFVVTAVYAVLTTLALGRAFEPDLDAVALLIGAASALLGHMLVFCAAFVFATAAMRLGGQSAKQQYLVLLLAAAALFAAIFSNVLGRAIGLAGVWGALAAAAVGLSIASAWGGLRLWAHAKHGANVDAGIDVFFALPVSKPGADGLVLLAAVLPLAWFLAFVSGRMDWDFAVSKTGVVAVWFTAFTALYRLVPPGERPAWLLLLVCGAPLVVHAAWRPEGVHGHALERYAVHNPSFRLVDILLRERQGSRAFDRFLRANTGLTDAVLAPKPIDIVPPGLLAPVEAAPHVFLLVIDSLRADYLSPYNANARFTPHIREFARENVAFRNAFTAYGGTGMSMPAIWAGSMLAHKQYILPFAPMNALEKLLDANGYQRMMTGGYINETLWTHREGDIRLQADRDEMDFTFCATSEEIAQRLERRTRAETPVFAQTLSQDLHVATIRNAYVPPGRSYPGFDASYAYQVERIDGCFGAFVDRLKQLDLYDNSIVVLTADHGDLLGEDGRWGHSYHLYPQVVQVPLLLHLPRGHAVAAGVEEPVFSVDITPTIYATLGYTPAPPDLLRGRSLVRHGTRSSQSESPTAAEVSAVPRAPEYRVVAASYGAVYAVVSRGGRHLHIADAVQGQTHVYERTSLDDLEWAEVPVDEAGRTLAELRIRRYIDTLGDAWGIDRRF